MGFIFFLLSGLFGGVLGGMGMGGGTILIPVLSIFLSVPQHAAQAANLVSFIPMSIAAIIIHSKKGYIEYRRALKLIVPAVLFSVLGSFVAKQLDGDSLKKLFGMFLILLAVFSLIKIFKDK